MVVITGASSGIGRAVARTLAATGWSVVLAARAQESLNEAAAECASTGAAVLAVPTDVSVAADVQALFEAAVQRFGRVDAVVHSAASVAYGRFVDVPADVFEASIVTNVLGSANVARAALIRFQEQRGGHLVMMGSLLGKIAVPFMSAYVVGKWGVHALTRTLRVEARSTPGVRVSMISPGSVNTPAYLQAANYVGREGRPPPPIVQPEKVARVVARVLTRSRRDRSVGLANPVIVFGYRVLPAVYDAVVMPLMTIGGLSRRRVPPTPGSVLVPRPVLDAVRGSWSRWGRRIS